MRMKAEKSLLACGLGLLTATMAIGALAQSGGVSQSSGGPVPGASSYPPANDLRMRMQDGRIQLTGEVVESGGRVRAPPDVLPLQAAAPMRFQPEDVPMILGSSPHKPTTVDDAAITASIASNLAWSRHAEGLVAEVHADAGRVTLRGHADTDAALAFAIRIASSTYGVASVDSQLRLEATKSSAAQRMTQAVNEAWVALKLKALSLAPVDTAVAAIPAGGAGHDSRSDAGSAAHVRRDPPITLAAKARDPAASP